MLTAAKAAETRGWQMSMKETAEKTATLKQNGMTVHTPTPTLMTGLKGIGKEMANEWTKKAGAEGQAILKAYTGTK